MKEELASVARSRYAASQLLDPRPPRNDILIKLSRDDNFRHPCYLLFGSLAIFVNRL
jgi:hypothetical protein